MQYGLSPEEVEHPFTSSVITFEWRDFIKGWNMTKQIGCRFIIVER